jgi:hypothetical protein
MKSSERDFMKERDQQLIEEELGRLIDRIFPPDVRAIYRQNPLLKLLLDRGMKVNSKTPFTKKIEPCP